jgi:hypothetical protein
MVAMHLFWEKSATGFLILTCLLGGGAAWVSGRALARGWRPYWKLLVYMLLLGGAVRFFHWALLQETLLSAWFYFTDTLVLVVLASLSFRATRAAQMATLYPWLYRRTSPFTWTTR